MPKMTGPAMVDVMNGQAQLNDELNRALKLPDIQERMAALGLDIAGGTPEAFADFVKQDIGRWAKVIKEANIRVA